MLRDSKIVLFGIFLMVSPHAFSYFGPGLAGGVIAATLGIIGALFLAIFGVLYYPIKRAYRRKFRRQEKAANDGEEISKECAKEND